MTSETGLKPPPLPKGADEAYCSSCGNLIKLKKIIKHLMIPSMFSVVFFIFASLPADLLGCRNRGLISAFVAIAAGVLGITVTVRGLMREIRGDASSSLWMASALLFAVPAVFIVLTET